VGREQLAGDPRFASVRLRGQHAAELDAVIAEWTRPHTGAEVERRLIDAEVPCSRVFTLPDVFDDPHFKARQMLIDVPHPVLGSARQQGIVPKLSDTPGSVRWAGHETGADSADILSGELGYSEQAIGDLIARRVVFQPTGA
jgi:crotonobetainyl-CoA:carnitine CoA-transferase CaiB-like acyl-CoA transferase